MKVACIVNPRAHGGRSLRTWRVLEPEARRLYPDISVLVTSRAGEEGSLGTRAWEAGAELLIVVGGDGTLSGVVHGLLAGRSGGSPLPAIAPLPVGTGGDFARGLGYSGDPRRALHSLSDATPIPTDVGKLTFTETPGPLVRYWINQSYIGLGAKVVDRVNRSTHLSGSLSYTFASLVEAFRAKPLHVSLRWKGQEIPSESSAYVNLMVANGTYSGGGMRTSPRSSLVDGQFEVTTIDPMSRLRLLRGLSKFRDGTYLKLPGVRQWQVETLRVEGTGELVEADGEIVGKLPVRYEVLRGALRVLHPGKVLSR